MDLTEKTLAEESVFDGVLLHIRRDTVELPNGDVATREWMLHRGAAAVLAFDEEGRLLLVRQYRYPVRSVTLELPAGKLDGDEVPEVCAARELEEETGYRAESLRLIARMLPAAAYTTEMLHIYVAEGLHFTRQHLDADEFLNVERMTIEEALASIESGEILDAKTQIGILRWVREQGK